MRGFGIPNSQQFLFKSLLDLFNPFTFNSVEPIPLPQMKNHKKQEIRWS